MTRIRMKEPPPTRSEIYTEVDYKPPLKTDLRKSKGRIMLVSAFGSRREIEEWEDVIVA